MKRCSLRWRVLLAIVLIPSAITGLHYLVHDVLWLYRWLTR